MTDDNVALYKLEKIAMEYTVWFTLNPRRKIPLPRERMYGALLLSGMRKTEIISHRIPLSLGFQTASIDSRNFLAGFGCGAARGVRK